MKLGIEDQEKPSLREHEVKTAVPKTLPVEG
jgi:hypothetical protein